MKAKIVLTAIAAMMMVAVMAMPVVAVPADTNAEVTGSGTPPVIEEKFELNDDGDPSHSITGTQVSPEPDANKQVCVYIVATDPNGAADINKIWLTVNNPVGAQVTSGSTEGSTVTEMSDTDAFAAIPGGSVNACGQRVDSLYFRKHLCTS